MARLKEHYKSNIVPKNTLLLANIGILYLSLPSVNKK